MPSPPCLHSHSQLAVVLLFDGALTAYEDYKRHVDDAKLNATPTRILRGQGRDAAFEPATWKDVQVGDIVKVQVGEVFPADLVFLYAEQEDPDECTVCHVRTAQLDGETNLKLKKTTQDLAEAFSTAERCASFSGHVEAGPPVPDFGDFSGALHWDGEHKEALFASGLLLRGAELRNCEFLHGYVVYTGNDTKVRVKAEKKLGAKVSSVDRVMNLLITIQVGIVAVLSVIGAVGYTIFTPERIDDGSLFYLRMGSVDVGLQGFLKFLTFFLVTSNLVPISLYVSMRIARQAQQFFIEFDEFMVFNLGSSSSMASPDASASLADVPCAIGSEAGTGGGAAKDSGELRSARDTEGEQATHEGSEQSKDEDEANTIHAKVRRMDLNDELGQITHIFSDKTGTLTCNSFEFRKLSVGGTAFGLGTTPIGIVRRRRMGEDVQEAEAALKKHATQERLVPHVNFMDGAEDAGEGWEEYLSRAGADSADADSIEGCLDDAVAARRETFSASLTESVKGEDGKALTLAAQLQGLLSAGEQEGGASPLSKYYEWLQDNREALESSAGGADDHRLGAAEQQRGAATSASDCPLTPQQIALHYMMLNIALDHSVEIELVRDEDGEVASRNFSASSPDEEAFVAAAHLFGYSFQGRAKDSVTLSIAGHKSTYKVGALLTYTQARKMMSVLVKEEETGSWFLLAKGADSKIASLVDPKALAQSSHMQRVVAGTSMHTAEWAEDGLRTMAFAWRPLSASWAEQWLERYNDANADVQQREARAAGEPNDIDDLMEELESSLTLQGATGIEDRLQDEVGSTISSLVEAGVSVWMLTGDKQETAINIGYAVQMLSNAHNKMILTRDSLGAGNIDQASSLIAQHAEKFRDAQAKSMPMLEPQALVLDDSTIARLTESGTKEDKDNLRVVAQGCSAVIACRCSPSRKRALVLLIKEGVKGSKCLAVGDGANDVDMIVAANVGVGIVGAEGAQAANSADYAIGQFRFLQRLLLVHGRWNYHRMSLLITYLFYKNTVLIFGIFLFACIAGWSGQRFMLETTLQTFNVVLSGVPVLIAAVLDQDVDADSAQRFPHLYAFGRTGAGLSTASFVWWMGTALLESAGLFFGAVAAMQWSDFGQAGDPYIFSLGTVYTAGMTIAVNARLAMFTTSHSWLFQLFTFLSVGSLFALAYIADLLNESRFTGGATRLMLTPAFWLFAVGGGLAVLIPAAAVQAYRRTYMPSYRRLVHEVQVLCRTWRHSLEYLPIRVTPRRVAATQRLLGDADAQEFYERTEEASKEGAGAYHIATWGRSQPDKTKVVPFESTLDWQISCMQRLPCFASQASMPTEKWNEIAFRLREWPHEMQRQNILRKRCEAMREEGHVDEEALKDLERRLKEDRLQTLQDRGEAVPESMRPSSEGSGTISAMADSMDGDAAVTPLSSAPFDQPSASWGSPSSPHSSSAVMSKLHKDSPSDAGEAPPHASLVMQDLDSDDLDEQGRSAVAPADADAHP